MLNITGKISAAIYTPGEDVKHVNWKSNKLQYTGADVIGQLLAGRHVAPTHVYIEHSDSDTIPTYGNDSSGYYENETVDYERVPLALNPSLSGSDENYNTNVVSFLAQSSEIPAERKILGVAIVSVIDGNDVIISRGYFNPVIDQPAAPKKVLVRWDITIEVPS